MRARDIGLDSVCGVWAFLAQADEDNASADGVVPVGLGDIFSNFGSNALGLLLRTRGLVESTELVFSISS